MSLQTDDAPICEPKILPVKSNFQLRFFEELEPKMLHLELDIK